MLIKPCTYFYERYPATCKALRLVLVCYPFSFVQFFYLCGISNQKYTEGMENIKIFVIKLPVLVSGSLGMSFCSNLGIFSNDAVHIFWLMQIHSLSTVSLTVLTVRTAIAPCLFIFLSLL